MHCGPLDFFGSCRGGSSGRSIFGACSGDGQRSGAFTNKEEKVSIVKRRAESEPSRKEAIARGNKWACPLRFHKVQDIFVMRRDILQASVHDSCILYRKSAICICI